MELTALQLTEVKDYVALGWKQPDVQITITNHIKYRVQERMETDATLSLNDALLLTHAEFGPQSFKVFEDNLKAEAKNKYSRLFLKVLAGSFKITNLIAALVFIALVSWLFSTVQVVKFNRIFNVLMPSVVSFLGIYLVLFSMKFTRAKLYRSYYTMSMSNAVLFKWCLAPSVLMMFFFNLSSILSFSERFLLAGICCSFIVISGLLFINAGYQVHKAAIRDCEAITL